MHRAVDWISGTRAYLVITTRFPVTGCARTYPLSTHSAFSFLFTSAHVLVAFPSVEIYFNPIWKDLALRCVTVLTKSAPRLPKLSWRSGGTLLASYRHALHAQLHSVRARLDRFKLSPRFSFLFFFASAHIKNAPFPLNPLS
jgi:hypothetical protein